ncbi:MAG: FKBP-type peptidyl-prolyl cis-trans isomerase, partial [Nanoarchaeota archaeon]
FDSSVHGDHSHPLEFTAGAGELIKGFDDAVMGMSKGEEKTFRLTSAEAYGNYKDELIKKLPRKGIPEGAEVGMMLGLQGPDGRQLPAKILALDDVSITLDLNHPLAGKNLTFAIKVVEC